MELIAGAVPEIVELLGSEEGGGVDPSRRFVAYLSLSGGTDPTWLDFFAESARLATDREAPTDFLDARIDLGASGFAEGSDRTVERVDPAWISAVAAIPDTSLDRLAGRWIDRLEDELGDLQSDEKPWIRELAGRLVAFCRDAARSDVVFVWEL
jgi:hypothetical protein